jgi:hypothetical protein
MNDLTDLLQEASGGDPNRPLDPAAMVRQGRRRLYRRRSIATVSGVVAAVLVIVGGSSWLAGTTDGSEQPPGDGRPPVAGQSNVDGRFKQQVEVSQAEAERRCTVVWRNLYGPTDLTVELRANDPGPLYEGDAVEVANWLDFDFGEITDPLYGTDCVIPQAGLEDAAGSVQRPLPASDDVAGVRDACGRWLGWDFSGWQLVTADSGDHRLMALLRSTDGYMVRCALDTWYLNDRGRIDFDELWADPYRAETPSVMIATEAKLQAYLEYRVGPPYRIHPSLQLGCQREPPGRWVADCLGAGWVSGPEPVARIVITDVTGTQHEIPVVDGWYAFAGTVINHADIPEGGCPQPPSVCDGEPGELRFTVYAADGTVLAEYSEDKDLTLIT